MPVGGSRSARVLPWHHTKEFLGELKIGSLQARTCTSGVFVNSRIARYPMMPRCLVVMAGVPYVMRITLRSEGPDRMSFLCVNGSVLFDSMFGRIVRSSACVIRIFLDRGILHLVLCGSSSIIVLDVAAMQNTFRRMGGSNKFPSGGRCFPISSALHIHFKHHPIFWASASCHMKLRKVTDKARRG